MISPEEVMPTRRILQIWLCIIIMAIFFAPWVLIQMVFVPVSNKLEELLDG